MRKKVLFSFIFIFLSVFFTFAFKCYAEEKILPKANYNLSVGSRNDSYLITIKSGYMRFFYDQNNKKYYIEYYDFDFNIKNRKSISMELEYYGGFYASDNNYYIVEGQSNKEENDNAEIIRVIKYDTNWKKIGTAKITSNSELFGGEVRYPFDYGRIEILEYNGNLYIVTGHEGYVDESVGQGHQGFLMIEVNTTTLKGKIVKSDLWHSFAQFIKAKDDYLYVLEQSEGSRMTVLSKIDSKDNNLSSTKIPLLNYGGSRNSVWALPCYASVDDMEISSKNVLCLGTSIDQSNYDNITSKTAHNIYLTITPINSFSKESTKIKWLTNYKNNGKSFYGVKITKINDNKFMITWEESNNNQNESDDNDLLSKNVLHYIFIDGNGNQIGKSFSAQAPISDCHPIVNNSKVIYYASSETMVNFYTIDGNTGAFSKKVNRVAGENVSWKFEDNTLILSGTGKIDLDKESKTRYPVSSTEGLYISSNTQWENLKNKTNKIIIKKGITSISESAFSRFNNLKEVELQDGVKNIEKYSFAFCSNLSKIIIPDSVKSIGDDFLWTGYYSIGSDIHCVYAKIYGKNNSYAINYAKQNNIGYCIDITDFSIDNIPDQKYIGEQICPNLVIKDRNNILNNNLDYYLTYNNNIKPGEANVIITGMGNYYGTLSKNFKIIKSSEPIFKDVLKTAWYYNAVKYSYDTGIIKGYSDTIFAPNDNITRGQLVTILWRIEKEPKANNLNNTFDDVADNKYYTSAIKWASSKGIVKGYGGTKKFGPDDFITRQDLAIILNRYADYKGKVENYDILLNTFCDYNEVSKYAEKSVKWAVARGVISGNLLSNGSKSIAPKSNTTRAEAAAMLMRFINQFNIL